jgi:enamine deaminase RidA (YjgF/YER057c/UK114 family)
MSGERQEGILRARLADPRNLFPGRQAQANLEVLGENLWFSGGNLLAIAPSTFYEWRMTHEERLASLGLTLPPPPKPVAVYRSLVVVDRLAYLSGHGPLCSDGTLMTGRVGDEVDLENGVAQARQVGLAMLATLRAELGSLNRVQRVVKLLGMVNAAPDFAEHPKVINGCSELFAAVFGEEAGVGARSAVGMGSLPGNIGVEIEGIVEIHP